MSTNTDKTKIITGVVTLSYPHLAAPQQPKPGSTRAAQYSAALVIPSGADLAPYQEAVIAAVQKKFEGKTREQVLQLFATGALKNPIRRDVDSKSYKDAVAFVNARSNNKPGCVYAHAEPGTNKPAKVADDKIKETFYAGKKVRASLNAYYFDKEGNKGVAFALNNIQAIGEGERLDSRVAAEDEFTADMNATPAALTDIL